MPLPSANGIGQGEHMDEIQTDHLPLFKRGIEGDLAEPELATTAKSPLPPFVKVGFSR